MKMAVLGLGHHSAGGGAAAKPPGCEARAATSRPSRQLRPTAPAWGVINECLALPVIGEAKTGRVWAFASLLPAWPLYLRLVTPLARRRSGRPQFLQVGAQILEQVPAFLLAAAAAWHPAGFG